MPACVRVTKWGNRLAVLIPKHFAKMRKIRAGTILDIELVGLVRLKRRRYTCAELMAKFKPEHRHSEWDVGPPVGKEIW
jgi:antitoxin MazE